MTDELLPWMVGLRCPVHGAVETTYDVVNRFGQHESTCGRTVRRTIAGKVEIGYCGMTLAT